MQEEPYKVTVEKVDPDRDDSRIRVSINGFSHVLGLRTFSVEEDEWGYIVTPPERDVYSASPVFWVENNLTENTSIQVNMPASPAINPTSAVIPQGSQKKFLITVTPPWNLASFAFEVWVLDGKGFRARAKSDPRVNPKG